MTPPGHGRVQLRFRTGLTGEQYVTTQGWRDATLVRCPNHPGGGCSLARHGTYARKTPPGTRIARWYCPESHTTFSLLPDCLAARLPGTLAELEHAVVTAERLPSVAAAATRLRSARWDLRAASGKPPDIANSGCETGTFPQITEVRPALEETRVAGRASIHRVAGCGISLEGQECIGSDPAPPFEFYAGADCWPLDRPAAVVALGIG